MYPGRQVTYDSSGKPGRKLVFAEGLLRARHCPRHWAQVTSRDSHSEFRMKHLSSVTRGKTETQRLRTCLHASRARWAWPGLACVARRSLLYNHVITQLVTAGRTLLSETLTQGTSRLGDSHWEPRLHTGTVSVGRFCLPRCVGEKHKRQRKLSFCPRGGNKHLAGEWALRHTSSTARHALVAGCMGPPWRKHPIPCPP